MRKKSGLVLGLKRAFFIGYFEKPAGWTWFFVWQNVVKCVAKLGRKQSLKRIENQDMIFRFIF
jgi:hypothetical protein